MDLDYSAQPSTINGQNRNQAFTYDNVGRLSTATGTGSALGAWQRRFAYDRFGNRTGMSNNVGRGLACVVAFRRSIKEYEPLSRLLFERTPEQDATINDGTGALWSMKYTYKDFGAVATRQDPRGVITTYSYETRRETGRKLRMKEPYREGVATHSGRES